MWLNVPWNILKQISIKIFNILLEEIKKKRDLFFQEKLTTIELRTVGESKVSSFCFWC